MFQPIISASLSPNTEADDVLLSCQTVLMPWLWKKGRVIAQSEQWFESYLPDSTAVSFNSGRSALLAILKAFNIGEGDEVLVQAFTCVAVPNSVLWAQATPVYADIDATLNIDPIDVEKKITNRTKAIIVQHTFGIPADMDALVALAKKHNILLIEDCAHSLGATYKGKKVGTFGDAAFFSFGRDKVVSSVFGGMAVMRAKSKEQRAKLKIYQNMLPYPSNYWIFQQLLHPIAFSVILLLYDVIVGKVLLIVLQKLRLLSFPVYPEEREGRRPSDFPAKFPNGFAVLLLKQLTKLDRYNNNRRSVAKYYQSLLKKNKDIKQAKIEDGAIFLRYPIFVENPGTALHKAKRQAVLLGNWYHHTIDPKGVNYGKVGYTVGSCPSAEDAARHVINLPTRIHEHSARRVVSTL
ncbi:MAG: DegT/DnrJ/EryC1/StrS aminotransferase [Candidatus Gottesmanbacteria bacterium GW2011_GWA2_47_9]|uniref:DegT/DnrJ/EryC1/StrS aminotransferase n=2 Tax=Candidatus Gottesmaniibacteriota TaxID=1752720 RepID=A0A0G1WED1_9BACT|nr:MAG: DegT/DnrJ/EryC1/StrS aminotransferase [Candidatus Gottesmanbacteria bacterium GW2011_GWA2_47_9]